MSFHYNNFLIHPWKLYLFLYLFKNIKSKEVHNINIQPMQWNVLIQPNCKKDLKFPQKYSGDQGVEYLILYECQSADTHSDCANRPT